MFPPVTGTAHSFQITPHSTCSAVWVRISAWRRSQSTSPCTAAPTAGSGVALEPVPDGVAVLAHLDDRAEPPSQRSPGVVGLPAARGVEGGAVEVDRGRRRPRITVGVERAQLGVAQVQSRSVGHCAGQSAAPVNGPCTARKRRRV